MGRSLTISVACEDIRKFKADVVALKHAQEYYGADLLVAQALEKRGMDPREFRPGIGESRLIRTAGAIAAASVLMVGVPRLRHFRYEAIREFAAVALRALAAEAPDTRAVGMTIHGPGYGLDEVEALLSQLGGYFDALRDGKIPVSLEAISFVEVRSERAERLWRALDLNLSALPAARRIQGQWAYEIEMETSGREPAPSEFEATIRDVGGASDAKPHAFVAMPFARSMDDVYYLGIEPVVKESGLLCERVDQATFTGHILDQIKERIDTAAVVIADLTTANPNVYLEVGYAWGKGRPTILLIQNVEELKFDVQSQKCLIYERIVDLKSLLARELGYLQQRGTVPASR